MCDRRRWSSRQDLYADFIHQQHLPDGKVDNFLIFFDLLIWSFMDTRLVILVNSINFCLLLVYRIMFLRCLIILVLMWLSMGARWTSGYGIRQVLILLNYYLFLSLQAKLSSRYQNKKWQPSMDVFSLPSSSSF